MSRIKTMLTVACLACLGSVLGAFENMLPVLTAIPGGKLGIANSVTLIAMYVLNTPMAFAVSIVRVTVSCLLYGGINAFMYSLAGAVSSFCAMAVFKRLSGNRITPVGVSVIGAAVSNIAQVAVAWCILKTDALLWYLAMLLFIAVVSGTACGWVARECIKRIDFK